MASSIKRSAIPASGYMYQTLVGIRLLCDWLDNPGRYAWVKFEADDEADAQGLDDIFVERSDGELDLQQVKFTVDPFDPKNALSWAWLTARKGERGKSLLEKWSGAAQRVGVARLSQAQLITNRRPDAEFESHLRGGRVEWLSLPDASRAEIAPHLGGEEGAARFFARFEFVHSYPGYESLDRTLSAELEARHTDRLGWLTLLRRAIEWSTFKNSPAPDGRITLAVLRSTISERQPRPLDQAFRIPAGYRPLDAQFAQAFIDRLATGRGSARVLWGSPGQGKSTFLSHACQQLQGRGVAVVRHHYFLDLQDASDRFTLKNVATSLMAQLETQFGEALVHLPRQPERLRDWLAACGQVCAAEGKALVVVIDGLDHVWRENDQEIAPLNDLFTQLLPVPSDVNLVIGTQRVGPEQLPRRMTQYLDEEAWLELPRMRLASVVAWLTAQHRNAIFQLPAGEPDDVTLGALAQAMHAASDGHPLVLTYTFMQLVHLHPVLSVDVVKEVERAPEGDARAYYKTLWQRLSWQARDALHLIAEDSFIWPAGALERCLALRDVNLEAEIGHLLAPVDAGLVAFHGSLYVFIGQQSDHAERITALLPQVEAWLAADAPDYLRWAWLWLYESRRGHHDNLLTGTTRQWVLDALVNAFETRQVVRILGEAEEVAFSAGNYELAIRKRALKHRVSNGLQYQLDDADALHECALRLTPDPYPALLLASRASRSDLADLHQLATLYLSLGQAKRAVEVQERMRDQVNDRIVAGTMEARDFEEAIERFLDVAAGTGKYISAKVLELLRRHGKAEDVFEAFLAKASGATDLTPILAFACLPMAPRLRRVLETQAVRVAGWARAHLHEHPQFQRLGRHPLSVCWALLYDKQHAGGVRVPQLPQHPALHREAGSEDDAEFARYLHHGFFGAIARGLLLGGAADPMGLGITSTRTWISAFLEKLAASAQTVAAVLARGDTPAASLVYRLTAGEHPHNHDHSSWADLRAVRKALALITADLYLLTRLRSALPQVPAAEWTASARSSFFAAEHWRDVFLIRGFQLLHADTVRGLIEEQANAVHTAVGRFNEKASALSDLCRWASAYDLLELARELLERTYRCSIGFGWRKDSGLARLLMAVEDVALHDREAALRALWELAPVYDRIDDMTEDSGARPSDLAGLLLRLLPAVYVRYHAHWLTLGEWYHADRSFAAFVEHADLADPTVGVALAFVTGAETVQALRRRLLDPALASVASADRLWDRQPPATQPSTAQSSQISEIPDSADVIAEDEKPMPAIEDFPPARLTEFLAAIDAAKQYSLGREVLKGWFSHWANAGAGVELLTALDAAQGISPLRGNELFDLAFHLSWRLQGAAKAFPWLVRAHRHRYGWAEYYYGHDDSRQRLDLVAQHYPTRWAEFLALSTLPAPGYPERGRAIPDAGLVHLLLGVGEISRATSVLHSMVDAALQEFDCQPLVRPAWWSEASP
jgi:hypothetical protein